LLLLFVPMPLAQALEVPGATDITTLCGLGWFGGAVLLLGAMRNGVRSHLWASVILFVFVMGFYVKFFSFSYGMGSPVFDILMHEWAWADRRDLNHALVWSTVGFVCFAVTASLLLWKDPAPSLAAPPRPERINQKVLGWILAVTLGGVVVSLGAAIVFGYGQMGVEHKALPFHLDAVFTRFRISLAPAIFMVALWLTDTRQTQRLWMATLGIMVVAAVMDAYVRGSRGSIALAFVPVILLWLISGTYTAGRKTMTLVILLMTVAMYPVFTALRVQRIAEEKGGEFDVRTASEQATSSEGIGLALNQAAGRVVGIDSMMQVLRHTDRPPQASDNLSTVSPSRMAWLASGGTMVLYMTHQVVGIPEEIVEGRSPGFLGGLYLVGGPDGMVLLTILYTLGVWAAWRALSKHRFAAPLLAYLASIVLAYTQEGVYGLENPISATLAILIVVWVFHRFVVRPAPSPELALR
jgi:hypothetical protein